jgi:lipopolysaccharide export system protein LptA
VGQDADILTILDQAAVQIAPERPADGPSSVTPGTATFARRDNYVRFERAVRMVRSGQVIEADTVLMHLSPGENRVQTVELNEHAQITVTKPSPRRPAGDERPADEPHLRRRRRIASAHPDSGGGVDSDRGRARQAGRQIVANTIDIALAPDGSTPTALLGRENVLLTFPPEPGTAGRTIKSANLDAKGEPGKGLTRAMFSGGVQYRERGGETDRAVNSGTMDVGLKPAMSSIDNAKFAQAVKFVDGKMTAQSALAHYDLDKGTLALSGKEPGMLTPHVVTEQIAVDAVTVDVTLAGPRMKAAGNVRSTLKPASNKPGDPPNDVKMPAMLKQDQPVIIVAAALDYDGEISKGTYSGGAQLVQTQTSVKGESIVIDNKAGNLSASGGVVTTTVLDKTGPDNVKKKDPAPSNATAGTSCTTTRRGA